MIVVPADAHPAQPGPRGHLALLFSLIETTRGARQAAGGEFAAGNFGDLGKFRLAAFLF